MKKYNGCGKGERFMDNKMRKVGDDRVQALLRRCSALQKQLQEQEQVEVSISTQSHCTATAMRASYLLAAKCKTCLARS